jgi:predicted transcriptional regulator of viral defense system
VATEHDEMREQWMAVGTEKAILCHESALSLLDLSDNIPRAVHLLVPRRHRGLRRPQGTVIHTRPDDEDVPTVWRQGLPLTAPDRTLVDVVDTVQPEQAVMAVRQALDRMLVTERRMREQARLRGKEATVERFLALAGPVAWKR